MTEAENLERAVWAIESLPEILIAARKERGLSLRQAEKEIGIGFAALSRYENRVTVPDTESVLKILHWVRSTTRRTTA